MSSLVFALILCPIHFSHEAPQSVDYGGTSSLTQRSVGQRGQQTPNYNSNANYGSGFSSGAYGQQDPYYGNSGTSRTTGQRGQQESNNSPNGYSGGQMTNGQQGQSYSPNGYSEGQRTTGQQEPNYSSNGNSGTRTTGQRGQQEPNYSNANSGNTRRNEDRGAEQTTRCRADERKKWSYNGNNGPRFWRNLFSECNGQKQSPIQIDSRQASVDRSLPKMQFNYFTPLSKVVIKNNGNTIQVTPSDKTKRTLSVNNTQYEFKEIHFHWGSDRSQGSEHIIDGVQYAMEMHLVHEKSKHNLAVIAILFEEYDSINAELQHIVNELPKVMYQGTEAKASFRLDLDNLVPKGPASYFRYSGSLTTPECSEGVIWSVVKEWQTVGQLQMREFRKLFSSTQNVTENGCRISNNFRPPQPLNRRRVLSSL